MMNTSPKNIEPIFEPKVDLTELNIDFLIFHKQ